MIAASSFLADEARGLGAREVRVIPNGVEIPAEVGEPAEPPHVLFVGRLSEEKGILEFLEATEGLPRVIVGDGPLRDRVPEAVGFVPPPSSARTTSARRSSACRRGARATAWSRGRRWPTGGPVVATRASAGSLDAVTPETGLVVQVGDQSALRRGIQTLLENRELRDQLGAAARARVADSERERAEGASSLSCSFLRSCM